MEAFADAVSTPRWLPLFLAHASGYQCIPRSRVGLPNRMKNLRPLAIHECPTAARGASYQDILAGQDVR